MLVLESGANTITVTLNELVTLDTPEFVMILVNDTTAKKVACKLGEDLSEYPERYNKFTLTLNSDPTALDAEVKLSTGSFKYYIYESEDADTFDFAGVNSMKLEDLTGLVEEGKGVHLSAEEAVKYYKNNRSSVKTYQ